MHLVLETLMTIGLCLYYVLEAIVLFLVPSRFRRKDIHGQRVLITGAGSGLGRLMAHKFAQLGCTVVVVDVNQAGNEETATAVRKHGTLVHAYTCDLSRRDDVYRVAELVKADVGDIDILVNNAGIVSGHKILACPDALMQKTMDVNVNAHFWTVKSFLPAMISRNRGHIVTIASAAGLSGVNGLVDYCASKYAAVGFDEALRMELSVLGKDGVHTTVVCPYYINTGMFDGASTRFPALLPILDPEYVVDKIMDAVLTNQPVLCVPKLVYIIIALKNIFPAKAATLLADFLGLSHGMDEFRGRGKKEE
jgi:all-trans-retinol dehydrogenase (NAD+)